ncbi:sugar kinase [Paracoccus sp. (in: a-proteobacteria)]|uniref:sugar kinase n=1 Tax=Paracoccus sp. TaxID=267 RepID=UPI0028B21CF4|nr:sugar kinase [Paracoccus sp. (in: a-proteobacteria)]
MKRFVSVGECMVELSSTDQGCWRKGIAGDTFNTAWYARALLPLDWTVAYLTRLGTEAFSEQAIRLMHQNGIDTDLITRDPKRNIGLYAISLNDAERSFTYWRDNSAARGLADDSVALEHALRDADVIHVSGITLAILPIEARRRLTAAITAARARGALTVLDPNYRPRLWPDSTTARDEIMAAAAAFSLLLPSFDDEAALFGDSTPAETAARYARTGAHTVVVKNGAAGVTLFDAGRPIELAGLEQVKPVDTTGAGDSFNAGFLAAMLTGASLADAARAGHMLASQVVCHPGALIPMEQICRTIL